MALSRLTFALATGITILVASFYFLLTYGNNTTVLSHEMMTESVTSKDHNKYLCMNTKGVVNSFENHEIC